MNEDMNFTLDVICSTTILSKQNQLPKWEAAMKQGCAPGPLVLLHTASTQLCSCSHYVMLFVAGVGVMCVS